jgi:general stress protein YciG
MDNLLNTESNVENPPSETKPRSRRGFASMDPTRVRELARLGGQSAHRHGRAHEFTSDEARLAGRKGGLASHRNGKENDETTSG